MQSVLLAAPAPADNGGQSLVNDGAVAASTALCAFDLVVSVYITEARKGAHRHRYPRFDVFMYSLRSYAALPVERAYLYVELDRKLPDREARQQQLKANASLLFGRRLVALEERRLDQQRQWQREFNTTLAIDGSEGADGQRLAFFVQNDDHPYVDYDSQVLCEGVARLRADQSRFKSIFMSHWPEIVGLAAKVQRVELAGSYAVANMTQTDSYQIFNWGYLRHLLVELPWTSRLKRIDELLRWRGIYNESAKLAMHHIREPWSIMYVPLREQCRKFDAYMHAGIPFDVVPQLVLPPEANTANSTLSQHSARVRAALAMSTGPGLRSGRTRWAQMEPRRHMGGSTRVPTYVIGRALALALGRVGVHRKP